MGLSLRTKWIAALLISGAIPLGFFAFQGLSIQRRGLEASERQHEVAVISVATVAIERSTDDAAEAAHRVGRLLTEARVEPKEARLELAEETVARARPLAHVGIYDAEGTLLDVIARRAASPMPPPPPKLPRAVMEPAPRAGRWLPPEHSALGAAVRYVEPLADARTGARRAWIVATLDLRELDGQLEAVSRDHLDDRPDGVLLVDDQARVLAGAGAGPLAVGRSLRGKDVFEGQALGEGAFSAPYGRAAVFRTEAGEEMSGAVRSLPDRGWAVAARRPTAAAYAGLSEARRRLLYTALALILASTAIGALLAARTVKPVRRLVALARAYGQRRFDERPAIASGDELEVLGRSMVEMAGELRASEVELARRASVLADLSRYLPRDVAESIAEGRSTLALGGERRVVTVLFADVVAFTGFAEAAEPERVVALLNELFSVLTEVVFRHGGTVDKFMGDCIMAIFGAPSATDDHAARALSAAEDMHRFTEANAPAWKARYGVDLRLAIGVSSGEAVVGNLGSESRMEYTAIGDVVNVAARLEGLARAGQTLLTADSVRLAGGGFPTQSLGEQPLRGKRQVVEVFELL